uniref:PDEase domain-containing protein n=1 Tax=Anisakis simplex TaxID=6269 RepID=A0A0M3J9T7_ANISI
LTKGSAYEDAGLLNALKNIVSVVDKHQEEVKGLIRALFVVDKIEESNELQLEFASLISSVDRNMTTIWPSYLEAHIITGPIREMYRDVNGCVLLPTDNENLMPQRINLSSEMIAPLIRKNVFWKMQIWDENK